MVGRWTEWLKKLVGKITVGDTISICVGFEVYSFPCRAGTYCGVFRRQALDRGAVSLGIDHIVTGHNADDIAETVLMNSADICARLLIKHLRQCIFLSVMRGDIARLGRCTQISTSGEDTIRRSKPFKYTYEKEIVMCILFPLPRHSPPRVLLLFISSHIIGTRILRNSITSPRNVSTPRMRIVATCERS